jgi:hypothetical protein
MLIFLNQNFVVGWSLIYVDWIPLQPDRIKELLRGLLTYQASPIVVDANFPSPGMHMPARRTTNLKWTWHFSITSLSDRLAPKKIPYLPIYTISWIISNLI